MEAQAGRSPIDVSLSVILKLIREIARTLDFNEKIIAISATLLVMLSTGILALVPITLSVIINFVSLDTSNIESLALGLSIAGFLLVRLIGQILVDVRWIIVNPMLYRIVYRYCLNLCRFVTRSSVLGDVRYNRIADVSQKVAVIQKAQVGLMTLAYNLFIMIIPTIFEVLVVFGIVGWKLGWGASLVLAVCVIVFFTTVVILRDKESWALEDSLAADNRVFREIGQIIGYSRLIREFVCFDFFAHRLNHRISISLRDHNKYFYVKMQRSLLRTMALLFSYLFTFWFIYAFMIKGGGFDPGSVFLMIAYLDRMLTPLTSLSTAVIGTHNSIVSINSAQAELHHPNAEKGVPPRVKLCGNNLQILQCKNPVCLIQPGQRIFITGVSGSGKSTVLREIFDCLSGASLDQRVIYLSDEPLLVEGTVLENISLGVGLTEKDRVYKLWDTVTSLFDGRKIMALDQAADTLSDGEKQILAALRGMLRNPTVLIIDEGCNAMDKFLEKTVIEFLLQKLPGVTAFFVSHRGEISISVDWTITLDNGHIVSASYHDLVRT